LEGATLRIEEGERIGLPPGRNGSGKSTLMETIAQSTYFYGLWYSHSGMVAGRRNPALGRMGAAGDVFPCRDGYFVPLWIGVEWDKFVNFFNAAGGPLDDPRFGSLAGRLLNSRDMETALEDLTRNRGKHDLFHSGQEWRLPWAVVQDAADLLKCPQLTARDFFVEVDHPAAGKLTYPGLPYKISDVPRSGMQPAPLLGQHNAEVYCDRLGCAREDLVTLRDMGII
jgi:crotonobetainyl-CoA:carnitine CoA-transferase CaiB-like acyl-CoA transferase